MEITLSIIALVISVASAVFTFITFFWTAGRDRRQATLEAYNRLQAEVFDPLNNYRPAEIHKLLSDKTSVQFKTLGGYVARIEHFCVGIKKKIYDRETFYALAHGYFDSDQLKRRIMPIIEAKNSNNSREQFYKQTLSMLAWMDEKGKDQ